jgi:hypothetical protein
MNFFKKRAALEHAKKREIKKAVLKTDTGKTCQGCGAALKVTDAICNLFSVIQTVENYCINCSRKKFIENEG